MVAAAPAANAAEGFTTGQAARLVIGQPTFTAQEPGVSQTLLGAVGGVAYANDMLVVVDANRLGATPINHRVLLYKNLSTTLPQPEDELPQSRRCNVCVGEATVVLGQPDFDTGELKAASEKTLRNPLGVATDGVMLVVADTDNNRILIWNTVPQTNDAPADVVIGQSDFKSVLVNGGKGITPANNTLRGPQGVWLQNGKLFVADTGNNRVLIWNSIPTSNGAAASVVLGAPNFETTVQTDLTKTDFTPKRNEFRTPVAVTSDGMRLVVTDLGNNRVLIWNSIPTQNQAEPDIVVGQPDFTSGRANNVEVMCEPTGVDDDGNNLYPRLCERTLEFPRSALISGNYLFIADGGNDRVMIYNSVPTENGATADAVLGQIFERVNLISDSADPRGVASSGAVRTPQSLAFDGKNLFVSDPFSRRVMIFTASERKVPNTGVRNAASREVFAIGAITFSGTVAQGQIIKVKIGEVEYSYTVQREESFAQVVEHVVGVINAGAGDPLAFASPNVNRAAVILTARMSGAEGNSVAIEVTIEGDNAANLVAATSSATLQGGQDAAQIAPGTIVSLFGEGLSDSTASADPNATNLPTELAGVQVYFDGIRAPLFMVSPEEIRAQVPWEVLDAQSINAIVRTRRDDGSVQAATAVSVPIVPQNPGIFAVEGSADPRPGIVMHGSPYATGTVSVDGSTAAGNVATVRIRDRAYSYTLVEDDTLESVRNKMIELINQDPEVEAFQAGSFTRIRLRARVRGQAGNGIEYSASSLDGDQVIMTATTPALCCANEGLVTRENPALPGETILVLATGLGLVTPEEAKLGQHTGQAYDGPELNDPVEFVSSLAGGRTANVLSAGMLPGAIGVFEVALELNSDLPSDEQTQLTIAQDIYVSNIVTLPVYNPNPSTTSQ
ncbi:MAG: hypothetical protein R2729_07595 [Bryobacteraceae bacterium]